jgi:uncharacterized spore protein YtfJ
MSEEFDKLVTTAVKSEEQAAELVEKLFAVAQPGAVFGEPVTVGEQTVITASEVKVRMGFGFGTRGGTGVVSAGDEEEGDGEPGAEREGSGYGAGGGGGGVSGGRPVAAIVIGPDGVRIDPIMDVTKVALAFFTTLGSMVFMLRKMRKVARG